MEKKEIAGKILAYLADHPDAQDTLEGIAYWWLLERQITYHLSLVTEAVCDLVNKGLLLESRSMGTQSRYRINKNKIDEIHHQCRDAGGPLGSRRFQDGKPNR